MGWVSEAWHARRTRDVLLTPGHSETLPLTPSFCYRRFLAAEAEEAEVSLAHNRPETAALTGGVFEVAGWLGVTSTTRAGRAWWLAGWM